MARSSAAAGYLNRKKIVFVDTRSLPRYLSGSLTTHFRPHTLLPELRDLENPSERLATQPVDQVRGHYDVRIETD